MGVHIDASSGWEVKRAMAAGFPASHISMSTQELPSDFADLLSQGAIINCCSLSQLEKVGKAAPGARVGVRFNPGMGSGGTGKTNVGGPGASFGIWHEQVPEVKAIAEKYNLDIFKVHTHIGSGSDPEVWQRVSGMSLKLVEAFPSVTTLNLGGGYKVGRMPDEKTTDLQVVGAPVQAAFEKFAADTGRKLRLEIEPGTFMVANVGSLVCTVQDKVSTGTDGHTFLKLDAGMTDLLRPSLYGAQHPIVVVPSEGTRDDVESVVVVGHCCESGDLLTPAPGAPEDIAERVVNRAEIGDICVVEGCGAYTSSMSTKNYNSFPEIPEVLVDEAGNVHLVRERQEVTQIWQNERPLPKGLV
jgi:diaminopimelate decarboxylase